MVVKFGGFDILVSNVGILCDCFVKKMFVEEWSDVIDINLIGVFNSCKVVFEVMVSGGVIVNVVLLFVFFGFFG